MRATVATHKKQNTTTTTTTTNLDKQLRLSLDKLKSASTGRIGSVRHFGVNNINNNRTTNNLNANQNINHQHLTGRKLKRVFMSKVSTNCIREEKVTALKLHEVVCETLQIDIPLRSFRSVLKRYGKDMSSHFEFDDFLEIIRELSRDLTSAAATKRNTPGCIAQPQLQLATTAAVHPDGSGDSASCLMRMKRNEQQQQQAAIAEQKTVVTVISPNQVVKHATVTKHGDGGAFALKREHSPVNHTSPQLANENSALNASATKHSQTAREASTSPDKTSSNSEQNQVQPAELFISLDNISESSHNVTVSPKKSQAKCNTPGIYARQPDENNGKTILSPFGNFHNFASQSLPPNHVSQGRNIQFAAQAISIKKLEPNLIRLFISDNGEKTEFTVNTKAVLGKGSFGKVFKGIAANSRSYAVKELTSEFDEFEKNWKRTISRKSVQERLRKCPYIYKIYHIAEERKRRKYWHVFEMVEGISLHKIAHEKKDLVFKDQNLKYWFSQLFSAVHYLNYKLKIVHRDIKTDNVLILQNPSRIKLIDFDHATLWDEPITTSAGAPICLPPEVLMHGQHRYTPAADWWMIGVLLYDVITGRHPFLICKTLSETRGPRRSIDYDLTEENIKAGFKGFSPDHCCRLPGGARSLVHELLTYDPRMRLGFSCHDYECRILKHAFFLDLDWDKIWKWVEVTGPSETRMASSGDAKSRSRISSIESHTAEEFAPDYHQMARTPTPKASLCKHTTSFIPQNNTFDPSKINNPVHFFGQPVEFAGHRTNSLTYAGQHQKKRSGVYSGHGYGNSGHSQSVRWAHTARVSPLTMKSHENNSHKRKAQTSRPIDKTCLKTSDLIQRMPTTPEENPNSKNNNTAVVKKSIGSSSLAKPTDQKPAITQVVMQPIGNFQPGCSKYTMIQPLPCTVAITNESFFNETHETKNHQHN